MGIRAMGERVGVKNAFWTALRIAVVMALGAGMFVTACGGDDATCDGVTVNGQCQKKCDESKCAAPGMKCVSNVCSQPCKGVSDCPAGKICYNRTTDDGIDGQFCDFADFALNDGGTGQYESCSSDAECDTFRGYKCIKNECKLTGCTTNADCALVPGTCVQDPAGNYCEKIPNARGAFEKCAKTTECNTAIGLACVDGECRFSGCKTHGDCIKYGTCSEGKDDAGKTVLACKKGTTYPEGQFGTKCPGGSAAKECDDTNNFVCLGSGEGDTDAYCTKSGCQADSDCALGYRCSTLGTAKEPCQDACGIVVDTPATDCVQSANIGDGKEYSCGPAGLQRNLCTKKEFCATCTNGDDCRAVPDQVCAADSSGTKICTSQCNPDVSGTCPWGTATTCGDYDSSIGFATCSHKFGKCVGDGKGCEPCQDNKDCPGGICTQSNFTNERFCINLGESCSCEQCKQDSDCSGKGCVGTCKTKTCTAATAATDCPGSTCGANNVCEAACTANTSEADCGIPFACANGKCAVPTGDCTTDAQCGKIGFCQKGFQSYCDGVLVDQDVICTGGGCPQSPGGLTLQCYGGWGVPKENLLFGKCYGAVTNPTAPSPRIGCWPPQ